MVPEWYRRANSSRYHVHHVLMFVIIVVIMIHCYTAYDIWYSLLHIIWLREKSQGYPRYDSYDMPSYPWYFSSDELKNFYLKQTDLIWTLILSQWSVPAMTSTNRHHHIHDTFVTNSVLSAHLSVIYNAIWPRIV